MMTNQNYHNQCIRMMEDFENQNQKPTLLLHACCGPCSTSVVEFLHSHFDITLFFSNSNITDENEYKKRLEQVYILKEGAPFFKDVTIVEDEFNPNNFLEFVKGFEDIPEGGSRCSLCFEYRLKQTANYAKNHNFDLFCTTLSVSPHKNAEIINQIGQDTAKENGISFLPSDFKKKNGYLRSIELCKEFDIYRQSYCGCVYSNFACV